MQLIHQRNGDSEPYPCVVERNGSTVTWDITNADTAVAGRGRAELQYFVGDAQVKSETYATYVERALSPAGDTPPEPHEAWVDNVLEAASQIEIGLGAMGVAPEEENEAYADAMADGVASYLCNMAFGTTDCVVGTPVQDNPFVAVYNDVYSTLYTDLLKYDAVVDGKTTFGHYTAENWHPIVDENHDAIEIDGKKYPILYMNCSGFVTLLTKGRDYRSSPYYRLFTDSKATAMKLAALCTEKGDTDDSPWTFDCLNVLLTWRMLEIMRSSGCTPFLLNDANSIGKLRDGDLIFTGNEKTYPKRYKGISHCLMYFSNLDRLNAAAEKWGVRLKAYHLDEDDGRAEQGYVVHCSGSTDGVVRSTHNVLRIETLKHNLDKLSDGSAAWGVRVASNALNSAKLHQSVTGRLVLYDCVVVNAYRHNPNEEDAAELDRIPINHVESMREGTQNGFFSYSQYRYSQPYTIAKAGETLDFNDYLGSKNAGVYCVWNLGINLVNGPTAGNVTEGSAAMLTPSEVYFLFEVTDVSIYQGYTLQKIHVLYDKQPRTWERVVNYNGEPSKWREMIDATKAKEIAESVGGGGTGISAEAAQLLLTILSAATFVSDQSANIQRLGDLLTAV